MAALSRVVFCYFPRMNMGGCIFLSYFFFWLITTEATKSHAALLSLFGYQRCLFTRRDGKTGEGFVSFMQAYALFLRHFSCSFSRCLYLRRPSCVRCMLSQITVTSFALSFCFPLSCSGRFFHACSCSSICSLAENDEVLRALEVTLPRAIADVLYEYRNHDDSDLNYRHVTPSPNNL